MTARSRLTRWSWRAYALWTLLAFALLMLLGKLFTLQFLDNERGRDFLQQQGDARVIREQLIAASRGEIVDRNGELLAFSSPVRALWANPAQVSEEPGQLQAMARDLKLSPAQLRKRLASHPSYVYLRRQMPPAQAAVVMERDYEGVYARTEFQRFYPAGEVTAHLVGFTDIDEHGQEGLELAFDAHLKAQPGLKRVMMNARREVVSDIQLLRVAEDGRPLELAIDLKLQYAAYRELKSAVQAYRARSGSVVVIDTQTGEVLALVNQPSYNANDRQQMVPEHMRNRAMLDLYEPGSTVKPFTIAAALESGEFAANSTIDTAPGYLRVGSKMVMDQRNYGRMDMTAALSKSSNVATSKIALDLDIAQLRSVFADVGLGEYCATGFPGEQPGYLPNHDRWRPIEQATLSYGHGLSVTSLQLARAYTVLANDGIKKPISLLKLDDATRAQRRATEGVSAQRVISASTAREVRHMMRAVVEPGGTGTLAQVPGYSVAGKTGTAHKVGASGYQSDRYRATFAGMVPAEQPRLVAVVTIDDPRGERYYGGEIAAPVFSRVMQSAVRLLNIAPDRAGELGVADSVDPAAEQPAPAAPSQADAHGSV